MSEVIQALEVDHMFVDGLFSKTWPSYEMAVSTACKSADFVGLNMDLCK
jgi:hypothetical protein